MKTHQILLVIAAVFVSGCASLDTSEVAYCASDGCSHFHTDSASNEEAREDFEAAAEAMAREAQIRMDNDQPFSYSRTIRIGTTEHSDDGLLDRLEDMFED